MKKNTTKILLNELRRLISCQNLVELLNKRIGRSKEKKNNNKLKYSQQ